jgi:hypothetical protein
MKKILFIILTISNFCFSQNISEYQFVDWENNMSEFYNQIADGRTKFKKDIKTLQLFTTNIKVNKLVCDSIDKHRLELGLRPASYGYQTNWVANIFVGFCERFSDSLNQPVMLRLKNSTERCKDCSKSIFNFLESDAKTVSVIKSKRLKKYYACYFQRSLDGRWSSSFIIFVYKMRFKRVAVIGYELTEDLR